MKTILAILALALSSSAHASIINTFNGTTYQWLELTATQGQSRSEVESQLTDVNSELFGYQYASRSLIESLFLSYASYDGRNGWYGDTAIVSGVESLLNDFGVTNISPGDGIDTIYTTLDDYDLPFDSYIRNGGLYGAANECGGIDFTCYSKVQLGMDSLGNSTMATQFIDLGWDSTYSQPANRDSMQASSTYGSYIYTVVPVPAAAYLFGSGLIALLGLVKRRKRI